jgi:hypothetical protein
MNGEIKITESKKIAAEIKKIELEIFKEKYSSKNFVRRKRKHLFKSARRRRIQPR